MSATPEWSVIQHYYMDTKMNGWGLDDVPQNPFSTVFIDVQLVQKDDKSNLSYISFPQNRKKYKFMQTFNTSEFTLSCIPRVYWHV